MRRASWSCLLLLFASLAADAAPRLVTPHLPSAAIGMPYSARLVVASQAALTGVTVSGLPVGLTSAHNGTGTISITGTPGVAGTFNVALLATDSGGPLNAAVTLAVSRRATTVTAVSPGREHACAVVGGGVQCWGNNGSGKLGNNSTALSLVPVQAIPAGSNATAVSAGTHHTCAVVNGGVQCWGDNSYGQLGDGTYTTALVPVQAIAAGSGATAVSAGRKHSCAVVGAGIKCWGSNTDGELGNNSKVASPVPVPALIGDSIAKAVSTGDEHTCAVVDASAVCWGRNTNGQLGNGTVDASPVAVYAIFESGVTAVAAGGTHSCAVVEGGVKCWGYNAYGQLGNNTNSASRTPVQAVPAFSNATAVASGHYHTCAVVDGGVQCWGYNHIAQLGRGDQGGAPSLAPVQVIPAGSNVSAIGSGFGTTCAVMAGEARCWGNAADGISGNGFPGTTQVPVVALSTGAATSLSAGDDHSCAVVAGGVQCWGYNDEGMVGDNTTVDRPAPTQAVPGGSNATDVSAGAYHTCAVVAGGVRCWGYNDDGQLGTGDTADSRVPIPVHGLAPGAGVTRVAAGGSHSCAVSHGGVLCWGYGEYGQLGNGGTDSHTPALAVPLGAGATAVSAGLEHSCAVVAGGVQCWGYNGYGRLGDSTGETRYTPTIVIPAGSGATAISAGEAHTCAVVAGGVKCWGHNQHGKLGNNSQTESRIPITILPPGSNVTAVSAGISHTCAIVAGGVQCWGDNGDGQLGNNSTADSSVPVQAIPAGSNATAVEVGDRHSCAIVSGAVACWGSGANGQLGNPAYSNAARPAPVQFIAEPTTTALLATAKAGAGTGTVSSIPAGIHCGSACSASFVTGTLVTLVAAPSPGSLFAGWSGACAGLHGCTVAMGAAKAVTATFVPDPTPALTITRAGAGTGTVTSLPAGINCGAACSTDFARDSVVELLAAPSTGSIFSGWSGAGCSGTGACSVTMNGAKAVTATFVLAGQLSLSRTSVAFGGQLINAASAPQPVTLTNSGASTVQVTAIATTPGVTVSGNCPTLAAGATCGIAVRFKPTAAGPYTGEVRFTTNVGQQTLAVTGVGRPSLVNHFYLSILRRNGDAGGVAYWNSEALRLHESGADINETWLAMAMSFFGSPEYHGLGRDNAGFVTDLYAAFFQRAPDAAGLAFWTSQIAAGMPRDIVLASFMFSTEFANFTRALYGDTRVRAEVDVTMDLYRGWLSRLPDAGGLSHHLQRMRAAQCAGATAVYAEVAAISTLFGQSPEYAARGRSNAGYVADLYNAFLRRGGDLDGALFWIGRLESGLMNRQAVRQAFIASPEFGARVNAVIAQGCVL